MRIRFDRFRLYLVAGPGIVLFFVNPASAARLLQVYIEHDGNVVAHTYYDDGGRADAATVWRYLKQPPIMVDDDVTAVAADANSPLEATLQGELIVRFQHVDNVLAQARLSTLTLCRTEEQTRAWFLPALEVERTAGVAGLGPPSRLPTVTTMPVGLLAVVALSLVILVGLLIAVTLLVSRRPAKENEA